MASQTEYGLAIPNGPRVIYSQPFPKASAESLGPDEKAFIIASGSLAQNTDALQRLEQALGVDQITGVYQGVKPHTLWSQVLEIVKAVEKARPDVLITLGAGSITDAAKVAVLAVANNVDTFEGLSSIQAGSATELKPAKIRIVSIPTSLSGGEYSAFAGATHDVTRRKELFAHPSIAPQVVILDPQLCTTTPDRIWFSSGIRAVDHCVEAMCSLSSKPDADEDAERALRLLLLGLLGAKANSSSVESRLKSQLGVIESMMAVKKGVPMGASHGIGHQLGPYGVGHGETSCIILPAVTAFNASVNHDRQTKVLKILWSTDSVSTLLKSKNLDPENARLSAALDIIIRELGLPRSLADVGVNREEIQEKVAEASLTDKYCLSNPIPLKKEDVLHILAQV